MLTLSGTASLANYQTALRSVTFSSTVSSQAAAIVSRTIAFVVNDGTSNSAAATDQYNVYILGDMNGDGVLDNFDIQPFEQALTNPAAYLALYNLPDYLLRGDITRNSAFDNFDIQPFEQRLTSGSAPAEFASQPAGTPQAASAQDLAFGLALSQASDPEDDLLDLLASRRGN